MKFPVILTIVAALLTTVPALKNEALSGLRQTSCPTMPPCSGFFASSGWLMTSRHEEGVVHVSLESARPETKV